MFEDIINGIGASINGTTRWIMGTANGGITATPKAATPCSTCGKTAQMGIAQPTNPLMHTEASNQKYVPNQNTSNGVTFNADGNRPFNMPQSQQYMPNQNTINNGVKFNADGSRVSQAILNQQQFIPNQQLTNTGVKFN